MQLEAPCTVMDMHDCFIIVQDDMVLSKPCITTTTSGSGTVASLAVQIHGDSDPSEIRL